MKQPFHAAFAASFAIALFLGATPARAGFVTLEDPGLGAALYEEDWRPATGFASGGAFFNNAIGAFENWAGFALSRVTDNVTPGFGNQYSAYPGSGAEGSLQYAIGYYDSFVAAPIITLPAGEVALSLRIANTTYAALSVRDGDGFGKKFGGPTGNDPDYFKLTISGRDESNLVTGTVDFFLADYRFANNALDYIVSDWAFVDVSSLPWTTRKLEFTFESSDNNAFGMKTPAYFAMDNMTTAVPEPGSATLLLAAMGALAFRRRRA